MPNKQRQHRTLHAPKDVLPLRICANYCAPQAYTHSNHPAVGVITQGLAELFYQRRIYDKAEAMARRSNYFTEIRSGSEAGSYLRLINFCITQSHAEEKKVRYSVLL